MRLLRLGKNLLTTATAAAGLRRISVSQNRSTRHPDACSAVVVARSLATLDWIFATQYWALWPRLRRAKRARRSRPCQKSPSQKIARRSRGKIMSGRPSRPDADSRYLSPSRHRACLRITSHLVPAFLLAALAARWAATDEGLNRRNDGAIRSLFSTTGSSPIPLPRLGSPRGG